MARLPKGFSTAESELERASRDFGGMVSERPLAVIRPRTIEEVASAIGFANGEGLRVVARGEGHTSRGQSMARDGLVIDMSQLSALRLDGESMVASAGAKWADLVSLANGAQLTPPVLTDYLGLSVGGTLSVGGVGGRSFAQGLQSCNVEDLLVVTGEGSIVRCSREHHADLFDACRGGLGQCAVIVEARIRLMKAPQRARVFDLGYAAIDDILRDQRLAAESKRFDYILSSTPVDVEGRWLRKLEVVHYYDARPAMSDDDLLRDLSFTSVETRDVTYIEHATRLAAFEGAFKNGAFHPWMDLFVPGSLLPELLAAAHDSLDPRSFSDGHLMTYPLVRERCDSPLLTLSDESYFVLFDVLPTVFRREDLPDMETRLFRLYELASSRGARVYPIGFPIGTPHWSTTALSRQFAWDKFQDAIKTYDPRGILTSTMFRSLR